MSSCSRFWPVMFSELEKCQKSLEGYLEQKRNKFPRFYFVSNPVLLQILSQGSDPLAIQQYYETMFDSIAEVVHDPKDLQSGRKYVMHIPAPHTTQEIDADEEEHDHVPRLVRGRVGSIACLVIFCLDFEKNDGLCRVRVGPRFDLETPAPQAQQS